MLVTCQLPESWVGGSEEFEEPPQAESKTSPDNKMNRNPARLRHSADKYLGELFRFPVRFFGSLIKFAGS